MGIGRKLGLLWRIVGSFVIARHRHKLFGNAALVTVGPIRWNRKTSPGYLFLQAKDDPVGVAQDEHHNAFVLGGDIAGITVHLDERGHVIPLPTSWVPESLQEWGQVPDFVETLVSEDFIDLLEEQESPSWTRHVLTVLPETGCGVDNLDVIKRMEKMTRISSRTHYGSDEVACLVSADSEIQVDQSCVQYCLETIFECDSAETPLHRIRLGVLVARDPGPTEGEYDWKLFSSNKVSSPTIRISWERQFDASSSFGALADGGGLDGQRVSRWMGPIIQKQSTSFASVTPSGMGSTGNTGSLNLPGNLTLFWGQSSDSDMEQTNKNFVMEVRHHANDLERWTRWCFAANQKTPTEASIAYG